MSIEIKNLEIISADLFIDDKGTFNKDKYSSLSLSSFIDNTEVTFFCPMLSTSVNIYDSKFKVNINEDDSGDYVLNHIARGKYGEWDYNFIKEEDIPNNRGEITVVSTVRLDLPMNSNYSIELSIL